jgi:hypothetical protein
LCIEEEPSPCPLPEYRERERGGALAEAEESGESLEQGVCGEDAGAVEFLLGGEEVVGGAVEVYGLGFAVVDGKGGAEVVVAGLACGAGVDEVEAVGAEVDGGGEGGGRRGRMYTLTPALPIPLRGNPVRERGLIVGEVDAFGWGRRALTLPSPGVPGEGRRRWAYEGRGGGDVVVGVGGGEVGVAEEADFYLGEVGAHALEGFMGGEVTGDALLVVRLGVEGGVDEENIGCGGGGEGKGSEVLFVLGCELVTGPVDGGAGGFGEVIWLGEAGGGSVVVADDGEGVAGREEGEALVGAGVVAYGVAEVEDLVDLQLVERGEDRGKGFEVRVDVGEEGVAHVNFKD